MQLIQSLRRWAQGLTGYFVYLLFFATLGPFLFGYHLAELNAPQDVLTCVRKSLGTAATGLPQCIPMNPTQIGLVSSIFTLGGFFGAISAGPFSTRFGRLLPMRLTTLASAIGPAAEALAPNIAILALGRFLSGLGVGAAMVVVPLYVSEISPAAKRGFFGAFTQIMVNAGIFAAQFLGYFLSYDQMWRFVLAAGGIFAIIQIAGLMFAVDSPKWQADHGRTRAAKASLRRIRGQDADLSEETEGWKSGTSDDRDSEQETLLHDHHDLSHSDGGSGSAKDKSAALGIFEILGHPLHGRPTMLVMMVLVIQQFCGINSIVMYGVSLLSDLLAANSALLNIVVSAINIVATTSFAPLVDVLGRKPCLLGSIAGMGISSVFLGVGIRSSVPILSALSVLFFVASFAFGLGPVPFILSSELVGPEAVGATQSWGLAANWIATFVVAQFFPMVNQALGKGIIYFIFAGLAVLSFTLVMVLVPETKGKKDADEVWGRVSHRED